MTTGGALGAPVSLSIIFKTVLQTGGNDLLPVAADDTGE